MSNSLCLNLFKYVRVNVFRRRNYGKYLSLNSGSLTYLQFPYRWNYMCWSFAMAYNAPTIHLRSCLPIFKSPFSTSLSQQTATAGLLLHTIVISKDGVESEESFRKADLAYITSLQTRDLRVVDVNFRNHPQSIIVRDKAIVARVDFARVIIMSDRLIICDPSHPFVHSVLLPNVREKLSLRMPSASNTTSLLPFEFLVLDGVLMSVDQTMFQQLQNISPAITDTLDRLTLDPSQTNLERLLPLKNSLNEFFTLTKAIGAIVDELLGNDHDLVKMYLTSKSEGERRALHDHEEIEIMLENYAKDYHQIASELQMLTGTISSTEAIIMLGLDSTRNRLIRLDMLLSVGTFSVTCSCLIVGIFGMNLTTHLESNPSAFFLVSGATIGVAVVITSSLFNFARRRKIL